MKIHTKKIFFFLFTLLIVVTPLFVFAEQLPPYTLLADGIPYIGEVSEADGLKGYLSAFFKLGIGIAVTLSVLLFVYSGVVYMTSDVSGKKGEAIASFKNIVFGLLIIFASVLVLTQINPQLTNFELFNSIERAKRCIQNPRAVGCTNPNVAPPVVTPPNGTPPDNMLEYDPGISPQILHASSRLSSLLDCLAGSLPGNVGRVSSISDSKITSGQKTFAQCAAGGQSVGCAHRVGSLHYGGTACVGQSYAVDFGDEQNMSTIGAAARACDSGAVLVNEGNHSHISVGGAAGCGSGN